MRNELQDTIDRIESRAILIQERIGFMKLFGQLQKDIELLVKLSYNQGVEDAITLLESMAVEDYPITCLTALKK